jgi:hypothetical protein
MLIAPQLIKNLAILNDPEGFIAMLTKSSH